MQEFDRAAVRPARAGARCIQLTNLEDTRAFERLHAALASYSGHLRHGTARRAWTGVWKRYPWLAAVYTREDWTFDMRWSVSRTTSDAPSLRSQYAAVLRHAGEDCLLFFSTGAFHRILQSAAHSGGARARSAAHTPRPIVLCLYRGVPAPLQRQVSAPCARPGVQSRLGPASASGARCGLGAPADEDSLAASSWRRCTGSRPDAIRVDALGSVSE